jgi:hypothetical protein
MTGRARQRVSYMSREKPGRAPREDRKNERVQDPPQIKREEDEEEARLTMSRRRGREECGCVSEEGGTAAG